MKLIRESTACLLAIYTRLQGVCFQRHLRLLEGAQTLPSRSPGRLPCACYSAGMEFESDVEQGALVYVPENAGTGHLSRMFPFSYSDRASRQGSILKIAAEPLTNPLPEVELAKNSYRYNNIVCGFLHSKESAGTAFPITPATSRAHFMSCQHVTKGESWLFHSCC